MGEVVRRYYRDRQTKKRTDKQIDRQPDRHLKRNMRNKYEIRNSKSDNGTDKEKDVLQTNLEDMKGRST